ncbi:hypothetical protein [Parabacteroides distasonis]|uniref:DUF1735 domain-containing protein n=1 Tax=Parabacteroides distasonis TaxID=823 RepID=A0A4S2EH38_PARDI|nr:hypothetical protein [Parabacteroides distasonis]TGY54975.1 hypothetical protein E5342_15790 [Parabacteroides distasonis]
MKHTILILLSCALLSAGFACSDDDELKVDPNALVNTQWAAHDTIPWMALGVYPLIGTYNLSLGETDFTLDVQEVASRQPCWANDTTYQVTGTYSFEPPILYLRSETETIEAKVNYNITEIIVATTQNEVTLRQRSAN